MQTRGAVEPPWTRGLIHDTLYLSYLQDQPSRHLNDGLRSTVLKTLCFMLTGKAVDSRTTVPTWPAHGLASPRESVTIPTIVARTLAKVA